ncbi:Retrovirus-related Pol polyprotein from transposon TNT 1-94 [Gossypium australe]|uniref:Retrovirus-related Pol polyprotein from transposon TNT 1-94 n=1 Tax=Gossypium australe TaxID=47621 RepID=A0A5B6V0S2_9ROSI|nr:Retrovirus-related Pol polyprotein from transposon TNT 1-94 [Gossypium australe]
MFEKAPLEDVFTWEVIWFNGATKSKEVEYIATGSCSQLLWMRQMLNDFGIVLSISTTYCDNTSAINILKKTLYNTLEPNTSI